MISRLRRASALVAVTFGSALLAVACQKVPLLAPTGSTITLTSASTALPINGSTDVIAQVIEAGGTPPHSGTLITFTTNLGTIQPSEAETDISGRVTVRYVAGGGSGTATITAISGGVSASGTGAIKIAVGAAAVGGVNLSASPTALPATGGTTTVSAVVTDSGGNPLSGVPVTFSTDNGSLATSVVNTDGAGRAQTTLTTSRTAKVTATAGVATPGSGTGGTGGTTVSTNTVTINVNAAAAVVIGAFTPTAPAAGQAVSFTLTVTPAATGAAVQSVVVNFGDGRSQSLGAVSGATSLSHTYDSPGTYTVLATVIDSNGDQFSATATVSVGTRPRPTVSVSVTAPATPGTATTITLTGTPSSVSNAAIASMFVDFGDGQQQTLQGNPTSVQHVYLSSAQFTITAVATDTSGSTGSGSTVVVVGGTVPTAGYTISPEPSLIGQSVTFNGGDSVDTAPIIGYDWDFGDGSAAVTTTSSTTSHTYSSAAVFATRLTIRDNAGRSATKSVSHTVTAPTAPTANFTFSPAAPRSGQTVFFSGADSTGTITNYSWDFGDGGTASSSSPSTTHAFTVTSSTTFTVRLTVTDNLGRTATKTNPVTVIP